MIQLNHLTKRFGRQLAVDDLTLTVPEGEIYGLLGHNGAGKSTAIGMMLGQVWPTSGEARICGYDVSTRRREALRKVGALFETPAFYDYLTGWHNLEILNSYSAPPDRARLQEVVEWVGLSGREHTKVRTYSHGMRARLALAQALLPRPELLILDEPSEGLDPEGIHEMRQTILRLRSELRLTILLSSHLLNEVEQLCTCIAVLNQGRLVFHGTLADTRQREGRVRLKVGDFATAVKALREKGLILDQNDGQFVRLSRGVGPEQVVRLLVERGMPVYEITLEEATLESFYLSLMTDERREGRGAAESPNRPLMRP